MCEEDISNPTNCIDSFLRECYHDKKPKENSNESKLTVETICTCTTDVFACNCAYKCTATGNRSFMSVHESQCKFYQESVIFPLDTQHECTRYRRLSGAFLLQINGPSTYSIRAVFMAVKQFSLQRCNA